MTQRSYLTQVMQNYLDATDIRSRENPTSLDAQLLNMAGVELEDLTLRMNREAISTLLDVPVNIDNNGVYYGSSVPTALLTGPDQTSFNSVIGSKESVLTTLTLYNDTLPIPSRITMGSGTLLTDPLLFTFIGTGDSLTQIYTIQYAYPGDFPVPNILTLWLDQVGLNQIGMSLTITGEITPIPAWATERKTTTEVVTINGAGVAHSINRWSTISRVAIRGLPVGVRLRGWSMPFNLPSAPDLARPYTTSDDRYLVFGRYWNISNSEGLLKETYLSGGYPNFELINSYSINDTLVDAAVEPNTNGMYVASSSTLYYVDRREVMPDVNNTGLSAEPLYGLQVIPDIGKLDLTRYVIISGVPYANANTFYQYRYIVKDPLGVVNSILPTGALGPATAGWRAEVPKSISFPLLSTGDYEFQLQTQDINGVTTYDVVPYKNAVFTPLQIIDLSTTIDAIVGIAFDSYGQLWIWNGTFAFPIQIHYDGYVFDADSQKIFVTEPFDSLQIS